MSKRLRITTPSSKVGAVLVALLLAFTAGVVVGVGLGFDLWISPTALTVWAVAILVLTRLFRGPFESIPPRRAWWRATATTKGSAWLTAYFVTSAASTLIPANEPTWVSMYSGVVHLTLACYFGYSFCRLRRLNPNRVGATTPERSDPS